MAEKLGMMQPGMGVPSESPVIRTERELKEARKLGARLYEYALTEQYIVQDTGRELARVRAQVARLEEKLAAVEKALVLACANVGQDVWDKMSIPARVRILEALPAEAQAQREDSE